MTEDESPTAERKGIAHRIEIDADSGDMEPRVYLTIRPIRAEDQSLAYEVGIGLIPKKIYIDLVSRMNSANKKLREMIDSGETPELRDLKEFSDIILEADVSEETSPTEAVARVKKYDHMFG